MNLDVINNSYSLFPFLGETPPLVARCMAYLLPEEQRYIETTDEAYKRLMQNHRISTLRSDLLNLKNWVDGQLHAFLTTHSRLELMTPLEALTGNLVGELQAESEEAAKTEINPLARESKLNERFDQIKKEILKNLAPLGLEILLQLPQSPIPRLKTLFEIQNEFDATDEERKKILLTQLFESNEIELALDLINRITNKTIRSAYLVWLCKELCAPLIKDLEELNGIQNVPEKAEEYNLKKQLARYRAESVMATVEKIINTILDNEDRDDLLLNIIKKINIPHNFLIQTLELASKISRFRPWVMEDTFKEICTMVVDQNLIQIAVNHFNRGDQTSNMLRFNLIPILAQKGKIEEAELLIGDLPAYLPRESCLQYIIEAWCTQSRFDKVHALINAVDNLNISKDEFLRIFILLLLKLDKPEDASQELNQIVGQRYKNKALEYFIDYYVQKERYDLAEGYFNQIAGSNHVFCCFAGIVPGYLKKGEIENARRVLAQYKSKISLADGAPTDSLSSYYDSLAVPIINAYLTQGNLSEAKALALTLSVNNVNEPLHKVALAFIQQGNIEEAKNLAERINDVEGYTRRIMKGIFFFHIKEKNLDAAKALLPQALPVRGSGDHFFGALARAYFESGNRTEAEAFNRRCQHPINFESPTPPVPTPPPQHIVPVPKPRFTLLLLLANKVIGYAQKAFQLLKYYLDLLTSMPQRLYRRQIPR